jgi:glycosyltransferase involved in cell wall biosynthesis
VYNRPRLLVDAVESVIAQTYRPLEVIVVDDGSTDETPRVVDQLGDRYRGEVRVVHQAHVGIGAAREAGRLRAAGEFIQYLDSDDLLRPGKFALQVAGLRAHPECGISYGRTRRYRIGRVPRDVAWGRTGEQIDYLFPSFLESRWWLTSTPLYRREVSDRAGAWSRLSFGEDYEYECRIGKQGVRLQYCDALVSDHRDHPGTRQTHAANRPGLVQDQACAYLLVFEHARSAGFGQVRPDRTFGRRLFRTARLCDAIGTSGQSRALLQLLDGRCDASLAAQIRFYRLMVATFGRRRAGSLSIRTENVLVRLRRASSVRST